MGIDNYSLEQFFNDFVSEEDGNLRFLRTRSATDPLEGYRTSDQDVSPAGTSFYGFQKDDGAYYIMKAVRSGNETNYTYSSAGSGYGAAWTNRASESYQRYADEF